MNNNSTNNQLEIWGGIECTYNRVGDNYMDQLERSGHYFRPDDLDRIAGLGVRTIRFPVIWEKHVQEKDGVIDWTFTAGRIERLEQLGITPIAGFVHHGSGPKFTSFFDGSFEKGLEAYATTFAKRFPQVDYFTPVNEPLTTARFCGLYGHWYPHEHNDAAFLQVLLSECRGIVMAMESIRKINPAAKLVQTDDLGKTHSTPLLKEQAGFENERRWLAFDLLSSSVTNEHPLYSYLISNGVTEEQLRFFMDHPCKPDIIGINHYVTSERYLDENLSLYPEHTWGGNGIYRYADVEAVRVSKPVVVGPYALMKEAWMRYQIPMAITEVHLHCTREEQLRWFKQVYMDALKLKKEGADIRGVTAWALFGSFDWCSLLTRCNGDYEPGLFDVRASPPRATALTKIVKEINSGRQFNHPVLEEKGWWNRDCRIIYELKDYPMKTVYKPATAKPVIITGKTGTLGNAFARICALRGIHFILTGREDFDITSEESISAMIQQYKPWAIINTAGFVRVDDAESQKENCFLSNTVAAEKLSAVCSRYNVKFVNFSSDLVFNGQKKNPYLESDAVSPLNIYGQSKARAEQLVMENNPEALIIRTSAFFGPWDRYNFIYHALTAIKQQEEFVVANDVTISPTYVPHLVNNTLDLVIDDEKGIWNLSNKGEITWDMLAREVAERTGYNANRFKSVSIHDMNLVAPRPQYSVLTTERGFEMPSLENALGRYFAEQEVLVL